MNPRTSLCSALIGPIPAIESAKHVLPASVRITLKIALKFTPTLIAL